MIKPRSSRDHTPIQRPTGNMARLNMHKKGARIIVNAGIHKGKAGTIQKVNPMRHSVVFEDGNAGLVQRSYCSFQGYPDSHVGRTDGKATPRRMSRLSSSATNTEVQMAVCIMVDSANKTDHASLGTNRYGSPLNGMVSGDCSSIELYHGTEHQRTVDSMIWHGMDSRGIQAWNSLELGFNLLTT